MFTNHLPYFLFNIFTETFSSKTGTLGKKYVASPESLTYRDGHLPKEDGTSKSKTRLLTSTWLLWRSASWSIVDVCESLGRNSFSTTMFNPGRTCTKIANVCIPSCGQRACFTWTLGHRMDYALGLYWKLDSFTHMRTTSCLYHNHNVCWSAVNATFCWAFLFTTTLWGGMGLVLLVSFFDASPQASGTLIPSHNKYTSSFAVLFPISLIVF